MPDVKYTLTRGDTSGIDNKELVDGQILFDEERHRILLDTYVDNDLTRIVMTENAMTGATSSTDGIEGIVPKPMAGDEDKVLTGGATWESLSDVAWSGEAGDLAYDNSTSGMVATDVNAAIDELNNNKIDGSDLGTAAYKNVPTSGDASNNEVVLGDDSRLTDSRNAADVYNWAKAATKPSYTASEVGAISTIEKGANNGVAELDSSGKVPSSQLPSFVDDVLEYSSRTDFPNLGESGKIYIALDTNITYRWSGSAYVEISLSLALGETSGTAYRGDRGKTAYDHSQIISGNPHNVTKADVGLGNVGNFKAVSTEASQGLTNTEKSNARANIGAGTSSLALGETSSTAYRGDRGKVAYDHSQTTSGNPHNVTKSDVGLGNVGNFKAVSTVASQGLSDTEKSNARANIGAGTSSFSGSYNDLTNKPTIPTVNNATLTIQKNGTDVKTFTANASSNVTANITVPTKVSELTNDSGYTTNAGTITGIKMNGASKGTSGVVNLGTVITAHQDISGKADKSATVSTVAWDSTNKKLTKTINGSTTDVVTGATILGGLTKSQVTTALGYTPPTSDTNTTYAAGTGVTISGTNNAINVTYGTAANTACQGNDSRLSNARTPKAHNQASNTITAMTGYSKPSSTSAIATTDSLNTAIGKLEKGLDGKGAGTVKSVKVGSTSYSPSSGVVSLPAYPTTHNWVTGNIFSIISDHTNYPVDTVYYSYTNDLTNGSSYLKDISAIGTSDALVRIDKASPWHILIEISGFGTGSKQRYWVGITNQNRTTLQFIKIDGTDNTISSVSFNKAT